MKKLTLIFTRDFTQWTNQMLRDNYVFRFPRIWGKGLKDQIVHYTGRATELYRYADDYKRLGEYIARKDINDYIFQKKTHQQFRKDVDHLRKLISVNRVKDPISHLKNITATFNLMYPFYTLAVFLPGPWREKFLAAHGQRGEDALKWIFHSREHSEGVGKECDGYLRKWLGPMLRQVCYPADYLKLFSVEEAKACVEHKILPSRATLAKRARGYVYMNGKIVPVIGFNNFLKRKGLSVDSFDEHTSNRTEIRGTVACKGGIISGQVKIIFNSAEVDHFEVNCILVTPMTSPEYLPAIKKAKAIVTDEGGLTCHAAIVSRELKIPCVIGTKIATRVLKDGDMVEVDADRGVVKKIK